MLPLEPYDLIGFVGGPTYTKRIRNENFTQLATGRIRKGNKVGILNYFIYLQNAT